MEIEELGILEKEVRELLLEEKQRLERELQEVQELVTILFPRTVEMQEVKT
ncbi:MAG: hypothetical protein WCT31_02350 [Candidatus Micrarchaeia archaeon]|jgi:hypothetical protein